MKVIEHVKQNGIESLKVDFNIEVKQYPEKGLYVLNYSQIDSPKMEPIVQECRGLILNKDFDVVCRTFKRFFNYGEADTKDFDFSDCTVMSKEDGSLISLWWNAQDCSWEVATRGMAFAEGTGLFGDTFRGMVFNILGTNYEDLQVRSTNLNKNLTYAFEMTSPKNRIVTPYTEDKMFFLGAFNTSTGVEEDYFETFEFLDRLFCGLAEVEFFNTSSAGQVVSLVDSLTGLREGVVVKNNKTGDRVKVKNGLYVKCHHMRGNGVPTLTSFVKLVSSNEQDEFLTYFPEYSNLITPLVEKLKKLRISTEELFNSIKHVVPQKEYALLVKDHILSGTLFSARKLGDFDNAWEETNKDKILLSLIKEFC